MFTPLQMQYLQELNEIDSAALNRNINDLVEPFKSKIKAFMLDPRVKDVMFITETLRTVEQQKENVKKGVSKTMDSNHLKGLAADIAFYGATLYPTDYNKRRHVADVAKLYGIDRGYDLWNRDMPHLQDNGKTMTELSKGQEQFLEGLELMCKSVWEEYPELREQAHELAKAIRALLGKPE